MQYMGSKARIVHQLLSVMLKYRPSPTQLWVEPFVGGGNVICEVMGNRLGADINPYTIKALEFIRDTQPNQIPDLVTEQEYNIIKKHKKLDGLTAYIGTTFGFGGKFFGTYSRGGRGGIAKDSLTNMLDTSIQAKLNAIKQGKKLKGVTFIHCSYDTLDIPKGSIVYCDIPYKGTSEYEYKFDHDKFWIWAEKLAIKNKVFISEYAAPKPFKEVLSIALNCNINAHGSKSTNRIEKLFTL